MTLFRVPSETDLTDLIHKLEMDDWPKVSAHPKGDCLGGDRCAFVARAIMRYLQPDEKLLQRSETPHLTKTQQEVLEHWVDGYTAEYIAELRCVSTRTVEGQILAIYKAYGVKSRAELQERVNR